MEEDDPYAQIAQLKREQDRLIHEINQVKQENNQVKQKYYQVKQENNQVKHDRDHLSKKLCISNAMLQLQRNKSETNSMLIKNQVQDTDFIDPSEFFNFIKVKGYNEVDDATVARCYQSFMDRGVSIPTKESIEVTRKTVGTVHHYFEEMFGAIMSTLKSIPDYNGRIDKIHLGYEEVLAPSKHIPDYNIRDKRELSAGLVQTRLIIELKRETRTSKGSTNLIVEGLSDSISYGNAVILELLDSKNHRDADIQEYADMSIVSLALTPVELTAVRVYSEEGVDEYGQINFRLKQVSTRAKENPTPLLLHNNNGETHQPHYGYGFKLLVNAFYWSSLLSSWQSSLLTEIVLTNREVLKLSYRLGVGGSSDTYEASDFTAVKIAHNPTVNLSREALIQKKISMCQPVNEALHVPAVLSFSRTYIQMQPCGVPLSVLVGSLFVHHKLLSLQMNPDNDELLRTAVRPEVDAPPPSRPVGLLVLAFLVLQHVSKALSLAHSTGVVHSDLRIGNVVLASWSSQDGIFVKQPVIVIDRDTEAQSPCFNTVILVDWGNALDIGFITQSQPGNLSFAADEVLKLIINKRWAPQSKEEWESLAYLYWVIASPVLAECPWRINRTTNYEDLSTDRRSQLQAENAGAFEKSVLMMVEHAKAGGRGE